MRRSPAYSIPRSGLVAELLLDGNIFDTNDVSKNTYSASNISYVNSDVGYVKQIGSFDGSSSKLTYAGNLGFNAGSVSWSTVCSFKYLGNPSSGAEAWVARVNESTTKSGMGIGFYNNSGTMQITAGRGKIGIANAISQNFSPIIGETYFCVVTYNYSNGFNELFLWGTLGSYLHLTATLTGSGSVSLGDNSNISSTQGTNGFFNGYIGSVRHYNRVLSEKEITTLHMEFSRTLSGRTLLPVILPKPVYYWDMKGDSFDIITGAPGTDTSVGYYQPDNNGFPSCATFGATSKVVANETTNGITGTSHTHFAVFKTPATLPSSSAGRVYDVANNAGNIDAVLWYWQGTGKFRFGTYDGITATIEDTSNTLTSTWYILVGVANGTSGKFYVKPFGSPTRAMTGTTRNITPGYDGIAIGSYKSGGDYIGANANALIKTVGSFNTNLSTEQVNFLISQLESGLYQYPFQYTIPASLLQKCSIYVPGLIKDSTIFDISPNRNHGSTTSSPTNKRILQSIYASYTNAQKSAFTGISLANQSFTISLWVKDNNSVGTNNACCGLGTNSTRNGLQLGSRTSNLFLFGFYSDDLFSTSPVVRGRWTHWACTFNALTNVKKIYRNGSLDNSGVAGGNFTGTGTLYWNAYYGGTIEGANDLADALVATYEFSQEEIQQHYYSTYRN